MRTMTELEQIDFFKKEIQDRWPEWKPTETEHSDWISRISKFDTQTGKMIFKKMGDISFGKKPYVKDFNEAKNAIVSAMPKQNRFQHLCMTAVLTHPIDDQNWKVGYKYTVWFNEIPASIDLNDPTALEKLFEATRQHLHSNKLPPAHFTLFADPRQAQAYSRELNPNL